MKKLNYLMVFLFFVACTHQMKQQDAADASVDTSWMQHDTAQMTYDRFDFLVDSNGYVRHHPRFFYLMVNGSHSNYGDSGTLNIGRDSVIRVYDSARAAIEIIFTDAEFGASFKIRQFTTFRKAFDWYIKEKLGWDFARWEDE